MKFISSTSIQLDKELNDLDRFAINFIRVVRKYTRYVIVSGYVAILLGRSRASEDIDIIIPKLGFYMFKKIYSDLRKSGFYCINAESDKSMFEYLNDNVPIRFAKKGAVIPNIELKCAKSTLDAISLEHTLTVTIGREMIIISNLELQIAF